MQLATPVSNLPCLSTACILSPPPLPPLQAVPVGGGAVVASQKPKPIRLKPSANKKAAANKGKE